MKNVQTRLALLRQSVVYILVLLPLSGCANLLSQSTPVSAPVKEVVLGNAELYTFRLAQELFSNIQVDRQYRYAVAGFVPVTSMKVDLNQQGPLMLLGHQLEQGLMTEAVRRGLTAHDFKATNGIIMSEHADRALSRNLEHLSQMQNVDYYITGTITPQQSGAMVNARIINVRNKDVIAAATSFFPAELFWQQEQVTTRNGHLYRTETPRIDNPSTHRHFWSNL